MGELTNHFFYDRSCWLRCIDVRFKMGCLILLSLVIIKADFLGLFLLFLTQSLIFLASRISLKKTIRDLRFFFLFLVFIFIAQTLSAAGENVLFQIYFFSLEISITQEALKTGALVCFRLFLIVVLSYLFISSTLSSEVKMAVAWFLKPVPLIPENRVATMLSLLMRFLPLIVQQAEETAAAQRARGVNNRKNPVYRFMKLTTPMLRRTFLRTNDLILAMEARGYSEKRTMKKLSANKRDWLCLGIVITLSLLVMLAQM